MKRKVVWNACYGGFNLSPRAKKMLYEKKHPGETVYFYREIHNEDRDTYTFLRIDEEDLETCDAPIIYCMSLDFGKEITYASGSDDDKNFNNHHVWIIDIDRHDPDLISVVEELGTEKASGRYSKLKITDIGEPPYHIDEYDGYETVITALDENYWK